jgi:3-dehydroquinate dehydratase II
MSEKKILILNGVNLGELGNREVNIYGNVTFEEYLSTLKTKYPEYELSYFQSNRIEDMIETIYQHKHYDGIIINPGAYTHTSVILADAIKAISVKVVEVHISNLFAREQFRRKSLIASACQGSISGFGLKGYELALLSFND